MSLCLPEKDVGITDHVPVHCACAPWPSRIHVRRFRRDNETLAAVVTVSSAVANPLSKARSLLIGLPGHIRTADDEVQTRIDVVVVVGDESLVSFDGD